tara:strand:- start:295 stop:1188 length:894 start_codon:yes stop_codon:yes gene_type:complete
VHALEDEQTMQHDLMPPEPSNVSTAPLEVAKEDTIVYNLEEERTVVEDPDFDAMDLISTSELIKNIDVVYETVDLDVDEEDFIINEVSTEQLVPVEVESDLEDQTMLTFDLPISNKTSLSESEKVEVFTLEDNVNEIEVNDYIELIPVTEANEAGEMRYALDDHIILEQTDKKYEGTKQEAPVKVEEDVMFTKVTIKERVVTSDPEEKQDPFNSPISKTLRDRADERRQKMKAFNYKFNTSKIEEIEKEPAYKRQGVNLDESAHSSTEHSSRTSVGHDDNDEVQLRSNNSYLHDNVD